MTLTLITGGTRGIGAAIALRLARDGHDLVLGYARDDRAAEEARLAVEDAGARCAVVRADLTDPDGRGPALRGGRGARPAHRRGQQRRRHAALGPLAETPVEVIAATVDLNLTSALLVARAAVRALGTSYGGAGGVLVNISSGAATLGSPGEYVQYAAAKAGVDALTVGLAQEVAGDGHPRRRRRARASCDTTIHADAGEPGRVDRVGPLVPLGRAGEPDEVADAIAWLMSDEASYVTGTTLRVAGGR